MLTLAVQKSGRLTKKTLKLLDECDINLQNGEKAKLKTRSENFDLEILFMRDDDIPEVVYDEIADIGVVGENVFMEKSRDVKIVKRLGFAKCRLSIGIPKNQEYNGIQDLEGKKIATSYPEILKSELTRRNINAEIHEVSGSVEIAPGIELADAVFDIVSTGSTLRSNGLKEVENLVDSEAILIGRKTSLGKDQKTLDELLFRINAVQKASNRKYILLNAPNSSIDEICNILPGMKSPTIMPLAEEGWSSIHSVISEDDFWKNIKKLKQLGAEGVLTFPIEKMIL
ncbi:MAG TPA: ATP phosphoribosyltransferase [bacterium]|nr:ATP phosphoribosyltransferase [bacterium]